MPLFFAMKHKRYINAFLAVCGFAIVGWLSLMRPDWLLSYGVFTFIAGYFLVLICLTPAGSLTLGDEREKIPLLSWLWKLFKGQIVLLVFSISAVIAFLGAGPSFAEGSITLNLAENVIKDYSKWQWGIFPWGVYGIWGAVIAYVCYVKKGEPYLYQIAREYSSRRFEPSLKTFVEGTNSGSTILAFSMVVSAIILLLSYSIEVIYHIHHFAVPIVTYTVMSLVIPLISIRIGRKLVVRLTTKKGSLIKFYSVMILIMVVIVIISCFANLIFIKKFPDIYKLQCQQCTNYFYNLPIDVRFGTLYWGWWLIWTPIAGSYLAVISKGRSLREFVIGLLIVPFGMFCFAMLWGDEPIMWMIRTAQSLFLYPLSFIHFATPEGLFNASKALFLFLLAIITWVIFGKMIGNFKTTALFYTGFMPINEDVKQNRLWLKDGIRMQGISMLGKKLWFSVIGTLFLHTLAGWYGIQVQVGALAILVLAALYAAIDLFFVRFFTDKVWVGNRNIPPY